MYDLIGSTAVNSATNHCSCPGYRQHTPPPHIHRHFKETCVSLQPWREGVVYNTIAHPPTGCPSPLRCCRSTGGHQGYYARHAKGCGQLRAWIRNGDYYLFTKHVPKCSQQLSRSQIQRNLAGHEATLLCVGLYATVINA